jgi:hypothetical protein
MFRYAVEATKLCFTRICGLDRNSAHLVQEYLARNELEDYRTAYEREIEDAPRHVLEDNHTVRAQPGLASRLEIWFRMERDLMRKLYPDLCRAILGRWEQLTDLYLRFPPIKRDLTARWYEWDFMLDYERPLPPRGDWIPPDETAVSRWCTFTKGKTQRWLHLGHLSPPVAAELRILFEDRILPELCSTRVSTVRDYQPRSWEASAFGPADYPLIVGGTYDHHRQYLLRYFMRVNRPDRKYAEIRINQFGMCLQAELIPTGRTPLSTSLTPDTPNSSSYYREYCAPPPEVQEVLKTLIPGCCMTKKWWTRHWKPSICAQRYDLFGEWWLAIFCLAFPHAIRWIQTSYIVRRV